MLDVDDLVLAALEASGGVIAGRTRLQKLVFLASKALGIDAGYRPHYYGPYSAEVASTVDSQVSRRVLQEVRESFASGAHQFPGHDGALRRYTYVLTADGRKALAWHKAHHREALEQAMRIMKRLAESAADWKVLCYAAKLYHVLVSEGKALTYAAARERAQALGWEMSNEEISQGVDLLRQVGLVKDK